MYFDCRHTVISVLIFETRSIQSIKSKFKYRITVKRDSAENTICERILCVGYKKIIKEVLRPVENISINSRSVEQYIQVVHRLYIYINRRKEFYTLGMS